MVFIYHLNNAHKKARPSQTGLLNACRTMLTFRVPSIFKKQFGKNRFRRTEFSK